MGFSEMSKEIWEFRFSSIIWINGKVFKDCSKIQEFLFPLY